MPVTIEKRHHDHLWILTFTEATPAAVDMWEQTVRSYIAFFNDASDRYLVYDTTRIPNFGFSSYLRQRATILAQDNPDATGRVAVVLHLPILITNLFDFFIRYTGRRLQPRLEVKLFASREKAIAWVEQIIPREAWED